jgi:hypothetical protein
MNRVQRRKAQAVGRKRLGWKQRLQNYLVSLPGGKVRQFCHVMHDLSCPAVADADMTCTCTPTIRVHPVPGDDSGRGRALLDEEGRPVMAQ